MAATCPTTEAALQAGLLPTQERRKGCFAKASGLFYAYSEMQEKAARNGILQPRNFRRLVDWLGLQANLPAGALFYAWHANVV